MVHVYKDSVGVDVTINTRNDLTNAASCDIHVQKPDGTTTTWTPDDITISVTNSIVYYTTVEGDLDQAGDYILQLHVTMVDGDVFYSDAIRWKIYDTFEIP